MKKILLFGLLIASVGTAGYFLLIKSRKQIIEDINNILPPGEKHRYDDLLNKMTRQELSDTYKLVYASEISKKKITDQALIGRLNIISNKYDIFT